MELIDHGLERVTERRLFSAFAPSFRDALELPPVPSRHFVFFLAADTSPLAPSELETFALRVLEAGGVYACAWGPDSPRLEEAFDAAALTHNPVETDDDHIQTTSHRSESLESALWYAIANAVPTPSFGESCRAVLAITIANPDWDSRVRRGMTYPKQLFEFVDAQDERGAV